MLEGDKRRIAIARKILSDALGLLFRRLGPKTKTSLFVLLWAGAFC